MTGRSNTGFVKDLRMGQAEDGSWVLEAGHSFTEPDVLEKVQRGTIANTSAGIAFDHIHKSSGKKYGAALAHVALTNSPWLDGMTPFGPVTLSEGREIVSLSQEAFSSDANDRGGETVTDEEKQAYLEELGLSTDDIAGLPAMKEELEKYKTEDRERQIDDTIDAWEKEGKSPAVLAEAKATMLADRGQVFLKLSQDGKDTEMTATDVVKKLVDASPNLDLEQDKGSSDKDATGDEPPNDASGELELSQEVKNEAARLFLDGTMSEKDALEQAKKNVAKTETNG